jgi:opacity protein-like surface antigen
LGAYLCYLCIGFVASGLIADTGWLAHTDREYNLSGYFVSSPPGYENQERRNELYTSAEIGHFVTPRLQVGGRLNLDWMRIETGGSDIRTTYSFVVNTHLNPNSKYVLFVGVSPGIVFGGVPETAQRIDDRPRLQLELGSGLKARVGENAAIRLEYRYRKVRNSGVAFGTCRGSEWGPARKRDFTSHGIYLGLSLFVHRQAD